LAELNELDFHQYRPLPRVIVNIDVRESEIKYVQVMGPIRMMCEEFRRVDVVYVLDEPHPMVRHVKWAVSMFPWGTIRLYTGANSHIIRATGLKAHD